MAGDKAVRILFVGRLSADLLLSGDAADGCGNDDS